MYLLATYFIWVIGVNIHFIIMIGFLAASAVVCIAVMMVKCGFFKTFLCSALSGVGLLLAIHFTSLITAISIPMNAVSIMTGVIGGIPSVAAMLVMKFF